MPAAFPAGGDAASSLESPRQQIRAGAGRLADCALEAVRRHYPHKLDHLILHEADQPLPTAIHPIFGGSYDWHSSVHMHWSLLRLIRLAPELASAAEIAAHFDAHFTPAHVATERAYAAEPDRSSFERPYGWAWLLKLQAELDLQADAIEEVADAVDELAEAGGADALAGRVSAWADTLRPFSEDVAQRLTAFLRKSHYPVRAGTHANSAFAMLLALDYAQAISDAALIDAIGDAANQWFAGDRRYPARYEPSGSDFLSAGLCEALLMRRVLGAAFGDWWQGFAPASAELANWLQPAMVNDRLDAQLVHLDGLNLSRAWCLGALTEALPPGHASAFSTAAQQHFAAAWPHVTGGDFAATHWLVSFALLSAD
ncbi:DUF2891 domain-containing protein [soil metagenome]